MAASGITMNMTPSHPGDFIRSEIIEELELSVTKAAEILGVRRATLSALLNCNAALSAEMALRIEKAFDVNMDMLIENAGVVRRHPNARSRRRDRRPALRAPKPS